MQVVITAEIDYAKYRTFRTQIASEPLRSEGDARIAVQTCMTKLGDQIIRALVQELHLKPTTEPDE